MNTDTEIFTGRVGLNLKNFYPDDMPIEWRFDYYSSLYNALALQVDTDEDIESILEDIDENFYLIIDITNNNNYLQYLKSIDNYKDRFILFSKIINDDMLKVINNYYFCLQIENKIKINTKYFKLDDKHFYYNNALIMYANKIKNDIQIKDLINEIANANNKIVIINPDADSEYLDKIKIICELLGF